MKTKSDKTAKKKKAKSLKKISKDALKKQAKKFKKEENKKYTKDDGKKVPKKEAIVAPFEKFQKLAKQIDEKVRNLKQKVDGSAQVKALKAKENNQAVTKPQQLAKPVAKSLPAQPLPELEGSGSGSGSGSGDAGTLMSSLIFVINIIIIFTSLNQVCSIFVNGTG